MQFRILGKRIQCIRAVYSPAHKRGMQKQVLSFPADGPGPSQDELLAAGFDIAEVGQLNAFMLGLAHAKARAQIEALAGHLDQAAADIPVVMPDMNQAAAVADRTWSAIESVSVALRKSGFPRPVKSRPVPAPIVVPGQQALPLDAAGSVHSAHGGAAVN